MNDRVLRVGILSDDNVASSYLHDIAVWGKTQSNVSIDHLIVHRPPTPLARPRRSLYERVSGVVFRAVAKFEARRLRRTGKFPRHGQRRDLRDSVTNVVELTPQVSASGLVFRFSDADVQLVRSLGLDLLIRGGGGILRGGILSAARWGVLSFHHADNRYNRGMPAAFWEVYRREDTTGFTLQRLTEELDGGEVLMRGQFQTRHYYLLNQAALYEKSNYYLKLALTRIAASGTLPPTIASLPYSERLFRQPLVHQTLAYLARFVQATAAKRIHRLLRAEYRWQVSHAKSHWRDTVMWRAKTIPNPKGRYLADPFVVERGGKTFCFVEDYDCSAGRGRISVFELTDDGGHFLGLVLDEPFHLSFPYLFEYEGELFMCPESSANEDVRVYRCIEFPLQWRLEKVIMSNIRAADTMLLERDGAWWMLTNIDPVGIGDHGAELFVFKADSPLSDVWQPHAGNPVVVDAAKARNAGILRDGGKTYRVSQKQGFDRYGKGAQINEIVALSDGVYEETCVATIEPKFQDGLIGTHHMHSSGTTTVFDSLKLMSTAV